MIEPVDRHTSAFAAAAIDNYSRSMIRERPVVTWNLAVVHRIPAGAVVVAVTAGSTKEMVVVVVVVPVVVAGAMGTVGIAAGIHDLHIGVVEVVGQTRAVAEIVWARQLLTLASQNMASSLVILDLAAGRIAAGVGCRIVAVADYSCADCRTAAVVEGSGPAAVDIAVCTPQPSNHELHRPSRRVKCRYSADRAILEPQRGSDSGNEIAADVDLGFEHHLHQYLQKPLVVHWRTRL